MNKPVERYSIPQILFGLHDVFLDATGSDNIFTADTLVVHYLRPDGPRQKIDLAELSVQIEEFFAFRCRLSEWEELFGKSIALRSRRKWEREFVPEFTFRVLAEFIAEKTSAPASFPLVEIGPFDFGNGRCVPSGLSMSSLAILQR
ncbi:hypothetical protein [Rubinisphaera margarita]|uniref:hypothetical protein n=1 Tax=Rubinisphaera margarita TaxID=2909586 RepID=UPI001EE98377|nr:hypothetical protein [Rubinisphaera margarita]MCG6154545.1 hypothetical protein [Rubinisphaera margarita]